MVGRTVVVVDVVDWSTKSSSFSWSARKIKRVSLEGSIHFKMQLPMEKLTATVTHGAAGSFVVNGQAAIHVQGALLHDALGLVVDAVTQFTGLVGVRWHLSTLGIELLLDAAAELLGNAQLGSRLRRVVGNIHGHYNI